jgi:uncharacterized protein YndB with AHSA1/START domain
MGQRLVSEPRNDRGGPGTLASRRRATRVRPVEHIRVETDIAAPIERVFEAVSDHETFIRDALTRTKLVLDGAPDRNGLGAKREVRAPLIRFVEEVTAWEPPRRYAYLIRESSLPLRHHGGELVLSTANGVTHVDWQTRFEVQVPVIGGALAVPARLALARAFRGLLGQAKARLER